MNKRQTEYIALYLFVFRAILLFGVLARKFVFVKGYNEFSVAVAFFATVGCAVGTLYQPANDT